MTREFRGPVPLHDRDFAEIRARVMQKIERRPVMPVALRLALAAAAVAALVFVLIPQRAPLPSTPPAFGARRPAAALKPVPEHGTPKGDITKAAESPRKKPKPVVVASTGAPPESDMHIEIQTADPNVRIIWIAR